MKSDRVGLGFDVHKFSLEKKPLVLGGVTVFPVYGLEAVSDGDVLLHALSDAICGACGFGDIGDYFPPADEQNIGIDSKKILGFVLDKMNNDFSINNVDITLIADKPKLVSVKPLIIQSLQRLLLTEAVNLKIKSKEGLNVLGGKESISCMVIVSLKMKG
ncbi:MAG: 2-C-methyl-D-erythritol 2,4-cyclodiphosphate synthase [Candidatus Omnitrophica bacterium]|nr:2-C-methyl-D-erythritol 2,4-cyclodiphosphate synthase [Candidatus Omnitrophota bacterium]